MRFLVLFILVFSGLPTFARQVSVSGKCEIKVVPDRGSVQLTTEKNASSVKEAVEFVTKQIEQARQAVIKMKLADQELRTTQFQVSPRHEWENNKNVFKGYRASLGLEVTTSEITRLGEVMGKASAIGVNGTNNYRTFLSLEKSQAEYLKCLDVASQDAQKKAERLAKNLDAKLGEVESILEGQLQIEAPAPHVMMETEALRSSDGAAKSMMPTIDVGDQVYSTTVRYVFKLK